METICLRDGRRRQQLPDPAMRIPKVPGLAFLGAAGPGEEGASFSRPRPCLCPWVPTAPHFSRLRRLLPGLLAGSRALMKAQARRPPAPPSPPSWQKLSSQNALASELWGRRGLGWKGREAPLKKTACRATVSFTGAVCLFPVLLYPCLLELSSFQFLFTSL